MLYRLGHGSADPHLATTAFEALLSLLKRTTKESIDENIRQKMLTLVSSPDQERNGGQSRTNAPVVRQKLKRALHFCVQIIDRWHDRHASEALQILVSMSPEDTKFWEDIVQHLLNLDWRRRGKVGQMSGLQLISQHRPPHSSLGPPTSLRLYDHSMRCLFRLYRTLLRRGYSKWLQGRRHERSMQSE